MQKNETGPFSYTIHNIKFKMDERPKCETRNNQNPGGEHNSNLLNISHSNFLLDKSPEVRGNKSKNELLGLHQDKKLLYSKGNNKTKRQSSEWEKIHANDI